MGDYKRAHGKKGDKMKLIKLLFSLLVAPLKWLVALIRKDRFTIYPGKVVQFIGLPGTGKTLSAHALMFRSKARFKGGLYATEDAGSKLAKKISPECLAAYRFRGSLFLIDESSLNGFDAREWGRNFRGDKKNILAQLKLCRHYHNSFITTSQSAGDNDSKLRGLSSTTYVCHKFLRHFIIVKRAIQWFEWCDGQYLPHLDEPSFLELITDPYAFKILRIKKWGKFYNTYATVDYIDNLPEYGKKTV